MGSVRVNAGPRQIRKTESFPHMGGWQFRKNPPPPGDQSAPVGFPGVSGRPQRKHVEHRSVARFAYRRVRYVFFALRVIALLRKQFAFRNESTIGGVVFDESRAGVAEFRNGRRGRRNIRDKSGKWLARDLHGR